MAFSLDSYSAVTDFIVSLLHILLTYKSLIDKSLKLKQNTSTSILSTATNNSFIGHFEQYRFNHHFLEF